MANEPLDDFEDDSEFDQDGFKWMSMIVLVLAVTGFFSLAWYAYQNSTQHLRIEDVLIVEADDAPIKRSPEAAGGMEFPHKDKEIYSLLDEKGGDTLGGTGAPRAAAEEAGVDFDAVAEEKAAAQAAPKADRSATIETLFNEEDAKAAQLEAKAAKLKTEMQAKADAEEKAAKAAKERAEAEAAKAKAAEEKKVATYIKSTPKKNPEPFAPPAEVKKVEPAPAPAPKKPTPPVKKVEAPKEVKSSGDYSGYAVQLGAVRSQAEAETLWKKVSSSHVDLLGGMGYKIVRADLGEKGVFYRLRVGGLSSAEDAKALCGQLAARSQGCFPAGKI